MIEMPTEVLEAKTAYYKAYDEIRDKIKANAKKYVGTKFADCPPLIKETGQFLISSKLITSVRERLKESYGECPLNWATWVAWYEKNSLQTKTLPMETKA